MELETVATAIGLLSRIAWTFVIAFMAYRIGYDVGRANGMGERLPDFPLEEERMLDAAPEP